MRETRLFARGPYRSRGNLGGLRGRAASRTLTSASVRAQPWQPRMTLAWASVFTAGMGTQPLAAIHWSATWVGRTFSGRVFGGSRPADAAALRSSSARRACDAITGLAEPGHMVLTLDTQRVVTAYRDALESTRRRMLGFLGTAEGFMAREGGAAASFGEGGPDEEFVRRMRDLLETVEIGGDDVLGLQFRASSPGVVSDVDAFAEHLFDRNGTLEFRFAWSEASSTGSSTAGSSGRSRVSGAPVMGSTSGTTRAS